MDYEELVNAIKECPVTYLPALLIKVIETCYERRVFMPGGASKMANRVEERMGKRE